MSPTRSLGFRRAFSLVEMLTVIGILAIVIAIIVPVMGKARITARNSDTRVTLTELGTAVSVFQTDQRRLPGYFNATQMGDNQNGTTFGFTGCENLMLDLIGGITTTTADGVNIITVGPGSSAQTQVNVDLSVMGSSKQTSSGTINKGYFTMDSKRFLAQSGPGQRLAANSNALLPVLIDAFGAPILAWIQDEVPTTGAFAAIDKQSAAPNAARFYWASNAGFLTATKLGKAAENQSFVFANRVGSLLGSANFPANRVRTMEALLGNPGSPDDTAPAAAPRPLAPRGQIVLHSAGADGVYLGLQDRGGKTGLVPYTPNQDPFGGSLFDDLVQAAGH